MSEERLNYIKEKVNMRNMANVMCGFNTDKTDNEILELIHEIEKLQQENKQLKETIDKALNYIHIFSSEDNNFCLDYHELNELKKIIKGR